MTLRLLSYNIRRGGRGREPALARVIRACAADLVVLQESTQPAVVGRLAALTGMAQWGARPRESLGFMAREPVRQAAWRRPRLSRHAFLEIGPAGCSALIFGVHLSAVHAAWTERRRMVEVRALLRTIRAAGNGFHASRRLQHARAGRAAERPQAAAAAACPRLVERRPRALEDHPDRPGRRIHRRLSAHAPERSGIDIPDLGPHVRLDYLLVPQGSAGRVVSCEIVRTGNAAAASDHFPLLSVIEI